jgi:hypothetical protein
MLQYFETFSRRKEMSFLSDIFGGMPCPIELKPEVDKLLRELLVIANTDDFLSEHPGGAFNIQSKHTRARAIGMRLEQINGVELMEWVFNKVKRKLGKHGARVAEHLGYCWNDMGKWKY